LTAAYPTSQFLLFEKQKRIDQTTISPPIIATPLELPPAGADPDFDAAAGDVLAVLMNPGLGGATVRL
jgi:hypothetical protein